MTDKVMRFILVWTATVGAFAQRPPNTPIGDVIRPSPPVPIGRTLSNVLPQGSVVRALRSVDCSETRLNIMAYDHKPSPPEFLPHISVLNGRAVVLTVDLPSMDEYAGTYIYVTDMVVPLADRGLVWFGAYRNAGDGAGSLFVALACVENRWSIAMVRRVSQGQLAVSPDARNLQLWSAISQDDAECTWCPHRYEMEVLRFDGVSGQYERSESRRLSPKRDPRSVVRVPIRVLGGKGVSTKR